jgi:hypothetical protein
VEDEMMDANVLFRQLGGNRFRAMTGAKDFMKDGNSLRMKIMKNNTGGNHLIITLNSNDLYDMRFESHRLNRKTYELTVKVKAEEKNIPASDLQRVFTRLSGLYTHMAEQSGVEGDPHDVKNFDKWCQTCGSYDKNPTLPEGYCDDCICVSCNETSSSGPSYAYCEICYEQENPDDTDYDKSGYYAEQSFNAEGKKKKSGCMHYKYGKHKWAYTPTGKICIDCGNQGVRSRWGDISKWQDAEQSFNADDLKFKEWADQEMKTHGKKESFDDWLDDELKSHGDNVSLQDWGHHELDSHYERYGAEDYEVIYRVKAKYSPDEKWEIIGDFDKKEDGERVFNKFIGSTYELRLIEIETMYEDDAPMEEVDRLIMNYSSYGENGIQTFNAEIDGEELIASSANFSDGSMIVGVGTETLDVDNPDFMEMMIDKDGKIEYFTLPIGKGGWDRHYNIKPSHYGKMKTQNETNETAGGDFIRTDGEGKYAESFNYEERKWDDKKDCFIDTYKHGIEVREFSKSSSVYQNGKLVKQYKGVGHYASARSLAQELEWNWKPKRLFADTKEKRNWVGFCPECQKWRDYEKGRTYKGYPVQPLSYFDEELGVWVCNKQHSYYRHESAYENAGYYKMPCGEPLRKSKNANAPKVGKDKKAVGASAYINQSQKEMIKTIKMCMKYANDNPWKDGKTTEKTFLEDMLERLKKGRDLTEGQANVTNRITGNIIRKNDLYWEAESLNSETKSLPYKWIAGAIALGISLPYISSLLNSGREK